MIEKTIPFLLCFFQKRAWQEGGRLLTKGDKTLWYLEVFKSPKHEDISLTQWLALIPKELVESNLNVGPELINALRKDKWEVVRFPGYTYQDLE